MKNNSMRLSLGSFITCFLALTLAAFTAAQKTPVSEELFQRFTRYTNFTSAARIQPCPSPPYGASSVTYINETSTDTQATLFRDDAARELILSFPGTDGNRDLLLDLKFVLVPFITPGVKCAFCAVHAGFLIGWNSVASQIKTAIDQSLAAHPGYKVIVTGHSLGAGLGQLAYASLKGQGLPVVAAYTMGEPRVGNAVHANYIDGLSGASSTSPGNYYRLTHAQDPIPQIPPEIVGYRHSRTEYWEQGKDVQNATTTFRCVGPESLECSKGNQDLFTAGDDHGLYNNILIGTDVYCGV